MSIKFRITVDEINEDSDAAAAFEAIRRYEQTVDSVDLRAVIAAINKKPRAPRTKKEVAK